MSVFYVWFIKGHLYVLERTSYWVFRLNFYKPCQLRYYWQWFIEWAPIHPYIYIHQSKNGSSVSVVYYYFIGAFLYWNWSHIIFKNQRISIACQIYWYQNILIISIEILKRISFPFNQKKLKYFPNGKHFIGNCIITTGDILNFMIIHN